MIWNVYVLNANGQPFDVVRCRNRAVARIVAKGYTNTIKTKLHSGTDKRLRLKLAAYKQSRIRMYAAVAKPGKRTQKPVNLCFAFINEPLQMEGIRRAS